jgi:LPS-assembly lipoprotein
MLLSDRRAFLTRLVTLPVLGFVAGCGFTPVYGANGGGRSLRGRIAYRAPNTPEGFRLRTRLEDRLGRVERGDYLLTVQLEINEDAVVISSAQDINRFNLPGKATWTLTEPGNDTPLASGVAQTFTAYSAFGTTVATREAQDDARDRLALALADLIVTDIIIASVGVPVNVASADR